MNLSDFTAQELEVLALEIQAELLQRQAEAKVWQRCPQCKGLGKANGEYCACQMGIDLRRVEERLASEMRKPSSGLEVDPGGLGLLNLIGQSFD